MKSIRKPSLHDLDKIKEHFHVVDGDLVVKKLYGSAKRKLVGDTVGYVSTNGYLRMKFLCKPYLVHRVVYYLGTGSWPTGVIDHINGDKLDNRIENLRDVTVGENKRAFLTKSVGKTSKYRGVFLPKNRNMWVSRIEYLGNNYVIGYFHTEKEAAIMYNYEAQKLGFSEQAFNKVFDDVAAPLLVEGVL